MDWFPQPVDRVDCDETTDAFPALTVDRPQL
jgi:hypothetical protein